MCCLSLAITPPPLPLLPMMMMSECVCTSARACYAFYGYVCIINVCTPLTADTDPASRNHRLQHSDVWCLLARLLVRSVAVRPSECLSPSLSLTHTLRTAATVHSFPALVHFGFDRFARRCLVRAALLPLFHPPLCVCMYMVVCMCLLSG